MVKRMLINVIEEEESRIAIIDDGKLEEIYIERTSSLGQVGNIYKGKVVNIEPSIQAAFVDIGEGRNGFLHVSDVMPIYGQINDEKESRKYKKRERRIQELLYHGAEVIVQITKDGIGNKAPTLTTYLSLAGRYVVLMPSIKRSGVSRKIEDENIRRKLKATLEELSPPSGMGYIIRTAGANRSKKEIAKDLNYLINLWKIIRRRAQYSKGPALIYQESDLVIRTLRDIFSDDIEEIIIDKESAYQRALDFMGILSPEYAKRVKLYEGNIPLFFKYGIEDEIEKIYQKKVPLKSGGHLVIEQTEALVAIDVNSGKYTDEQDIEETALKINLEAAEEIARQLRLRDLGGVIVIDFIDMKELKHKREVERAFREFMRKDRSRSRLGRISQFGIIEMTRQRIGPSIKSYTHDLCPYCKGQGWLKSIETMSLQIMRRIKLGALSGKVKKIQVKAHPKVVSDLNNRKRKDINLLEQQTKVEIIIEILKEENEDQGIELEKFEIKYLDENDMEVIL